MLDIKYIRENPEAVKQGIKNKNEKDRVNEILSLDEKRRKIISEVEELKATKNQVSAKIPQMKKAGELRHARGLLQVMGDDHDGVALALQLVEQGQDLVAGGGVEVSRGFVGQNHRWLVDQTARQGHSLGFATG